MMLDKRIHDSISWTHGANRRWSGGGNGAAEEDTGMGTPDWVTE